MVVLLDPLALLPSVAAVPLGVLLELIASPPVLLVPDDPPVDVVPEPASVAPLAGAEPAAPPLASAPAPAAPAVAGPAPVDAPASGVVVVVVEVVVSSAFLPQAATLSAAAAARTVMAIRMGYPLVGVNRTLNRVARPFVPPIASPRHAARHRRR
ncbi:MAG: hypothetical protein JO290_05170 [Sphingomonadaceae bacterium]|nr:hypothetical protein [Sphingomonadaceae bacterium]